MTGGSGGEIVMSDRPPQRLFAPEKTGKRESHTQKFKITNEPLKSWATYRTTGSRFFISPHKTKHGEAGAMKYPRNKGTP